MKGKTVYLSYVEIKAIEDVTGFVSSLFSESGYEESNKDHQAMEIVNNMLQSKVYATKTQLNKDIGS